MVDKKRIVQSLEFGDYLKSVKNINRACSTVIENGIAIFLPLTRIDLSNVYKIFMDNNQTLEVENDMFEKVEIKGRLLGQTHKDVLETLLTMPKTFSETTTQFKISATAYRVLKNMGKHTGDKQWLLQKLDEIAECRIKLHYKNANNKDESFNFSFVSSIRIIDHSKIEINFSPEYTYFMAHNELLDYSEYVPQIISLKSELKKIQTELGLVHGINDDFIKALVRYMLMNNGKGTYRRIDTLVRELNLKKIMSEGEILNCITDLRRKEVIELLDKLFGITLVSDKNTIQFKSKEDKKHDFIQKSLDL